MSIPTIEKRLQRQFILMSSNQEMIREVKAIVPEAWQWITVTHLDTLGDWHEVLLYRFMLLDLDEVEAFDPLDVINILRREYQINLPVFCFGGNEDIQNEMRMARADRFFTQTDMLEKLPIFFEQYGW